MHVLSHFHKIVLLELVDPLRCHVVLPKCGASKEALGQCPPREDWWHIFHGRRPQDKHCCITHSWQRGRTLLAWVFVLVHITVFPCGSSGRQGSCLDCVEFSTQKCMTSDHTFASGWGFGWLCFGILTPATNKDPLLFWLYKSTLTATENEVFRSSFHVD